MKVADGVEMLEIATNMQGGPGLLRPTLVWDEQAVLLVDTGLPGQLPQLHEAFDQAGVPFTRLNRVILTHHDIDHIGGLAAIRQELDGQARIMAYTEEIPYINGEKRPLKLAQFENNLGSLSEEQKSFYERMKSGFEHSFTPVDQALADGEELPFGGGITVIHTPGHTLGHICLYLQRSKTLLAGDALRVEDGRLVQTPSTANYSMDLYRRSLEKLGKLDIGAVVCYHGGLYRGDAGQQIAELAQAG